MKSNTKPNETASNKPKKKKALKIVLWCILIFIILNIIACPIITKIIYDSMFPRYDATYEIPAEFSELAASRIQSNFKSGDNELNAYLYDTDADSDVKDILVVVAPGMSASIDEYLPQIDAFCDAGWGVFAFDPTGNCKSEGKSTIGFEQELLDLDAALDYIEANNCFGYSDIVLFGHSRGGYAVTAVTLFDHNPAAIVSIGGINSAMEGIMEPAVGLMGNFAYANYPMLYLYNVILFGGDYVDANAVEAIDKAAIPTLIIHGSKDERIAVDDYSTYSHMDEIEAADTNDEVTFVLSTEEGCNGHSDILREYEGEANVAMMNDIIAFIDTNVQ